MHSLIPKCIEIYSLIENTLINLLNVQQIHLKMFYKTLLSLICTSMRNLTSKNMLLKQILGRSLECIG